jgi:hypothetical protein
MRDFVDWTLPELCSLNLLSKFFVLPI